MLRIIRCISLYFWSIYWSLWDLLFLLCLLMLWLSNNFWLLLGNRFFNLLWSIRNCTLTLLISSTLFQFLFFFKPFKFLFLLFLFLNLFLLFSSLFSLLLFKVLLYLQLISFFLCLFSLKLSSISLLCLASERLQYDFRAKTLDLWTLITLLFVCRRNNLILNNISRDLILRFSILLLLFSLLKFLLPLLLLSLLSIKFVYRFFRHFRSLLDFFLLSLEGLSDFWLFNIVGFLDLQVGELSFNCGNLLILLSRWLRLSCKLYSLLYFCSLFFLICIFLNVFLKFSQSFLPSFFLLCNLLEFFALPFFISNFFSFFFNSLLFIFSINTSLYLLN